MQVHLLQEPMHLVHSTTRDWKPEHTALKIKVPGTQGVLSACASWEAENGSTAFPLMLRQISSSQQRRSHSVQIQALNTSPGSLCFTLSEYQSTPLVLISEALQKILQTYGNLWDEPHKAMRYHVLYLIYNLCCFPWESFRLLSCLHH